MASNHSIDQDSYIENAVRAVNEKRPVPEIDFTLHTMEDGTQVSTLERVCKGTENSVQSLLQRHQFPSKPYAAGYTFATFRPNANRGVLRRASTGL